MPGKRAAPAPGPPDDRPVPPVADEPGRSHPRHRARGTALRPALGPAGLLPPAAVALLAVLGFRALQVAARPGEGLLAADGFSLTGTRSGLPAAVLSPDGLAALHMAVYATLTRAFARHSALIAAGRELLLVATLVAAVLLWRTARRAGLGAAATTVAVALFGIPALLPPAGLLDDPARLAVPWLLAAAWVLAPGRPTPTARALAAIAAVVAVLLAPDVALLALAGTAAGLATGVLLPGAGRTLRTAGALAAVAGFVVVLALRARWDPGAVSGADVPAGLTAALLVACIAVAGLALWRLPGLRATAVAVVATAASAFLPHPRPAALVVCLPLAALLAGGLVDGVLGSRAPRSRQRPVLAAIAALALLATAAAAVLVPATGRSPGDRAPDALLAWAGQALPDGARLVAARPLWAELLHAGADERQVLLPGSAGTGASPGPVLTVSQDDSGGTDGGRLVARFGSGGSAPSLVVSDPRPGTPTDDELARRRTLSAALLANPTTVAGSGATDVLEAAAVDPRLLSLLAALAARYGVGVGDFPSAPGEPAPPADGALARQALVTSLGGNPLTPGAAATDRLLAWADAQVPPFAPDAVTVTADGVLISFRYVSGPDALVTTSTP